jgi:hypothetical protein
MSDVNGIPNMGFLGAGGGYFGGDASRGLPAMNSDQINASMGWGGPNAAQFDPWANSGGFGNMTDYYSGLGAAYGRETGGFEGYGVPSGSVERGADLPDLSQDPFGGGYNPTNDAPYMSSAFDTSAYMPAPFSDRWGGMPGPTIGQPAIDAVNGMGSFGIQPWQQNYSTPNAGYGEGVQPSDLSQFTQDGTPWWTQGTDPNMLAAQDMIRAGRGWTVGAQEVGQDPTLGQNLNQDIYSIGQVSTPGMFDQWGGYQTPQPDYFSEQTQYPGGTGPGSGSLGFQDQFGNYSPRNEQGGSNEFGDRWGGLGLAGQNAGQPSQYTSSPYTSTQGQTFDPNVPPGYAPLYGVDNPNGALPWLGGGVGNSQAGG